MDIITSGPGLSGLWRTLALRIVVTGSQVRAKLARASERLRTFGASERLRNLGEASGPDRDCDQHDQTQVL